MKVLWCWRCEMDIPMLEPHEWEVVAKAHRVNVHTDPDVALRVLEGEAERLGLTPPVPPPEDASTMARLMWHLIAGYHMFTGVLEESPHPVWHHVVTLYGPPCEKCGKPLRTPRAKMCAACGASVRN